MRSWFSGSPSSPARQGSAEDQAVVLLQNAQATLLELRQKPDFPLVNQATRDVQGLAALLDTGNFEDILVWRR